MTTFGKRGAPVGAPAAPSRKSAGPYETPPGAVLLAAAMASGLAWFGSLLADATGWIFAGIYIVISVLFGFASGAAIRSLRARMGGPATMLALAVAEAALCLFLHARFIIGFLGLSAQTQRPLEMILVLVSGLACAVWLQTSAYKGRANADAMAG
jgi:hypothetical protein